MNNGFYNNQFGNLPEQGMTPSGNVSTLPYNMNNNDNMTSEPEYADNLFYINVGKRVKVYFSYPDSLEWRDKVAEGTIKGAGRDYLVITDTEGKDILFWLIYINYAEFLDSITLYS